MANNNNGVEEEAFEMKCKFEMKREDPRRKNRNCERMSGAECRKKGCQKQTSDRVPMAVDRKKMNERCVNDGEKMMSLAVNKIRDKTFVNEMDLIPPKVGRGMDKEKKELNESFLGLENDCTLVAALNPANKQKLKNEKEFEKDCTVVATLENEKCMEDDCTVVAALMSNESVLGLEYDCTVVATLNPLNEDTLKLGLEKDSTL
eukprot:CAMPEP_0201910676 /NCGR_PEP_ID=MMETSP0903-20130614/1963_1 /ASSEMBLY_ACC=CAM_ASM_000552 /TAXON_ID=420261 /ORGANISM="Thalassiosira antarctica, Strain CCMP982" /LENGTH=203 /DNA_ID=CAMNT_0048445345 /DNA_START=247 /DNA_END=854 /DNA_ORIENTATION=+